MVKLHQNLVALTVKKMTVGPFRFKSLELDGNEKKLMSHPMQIEK